MTSVLPGTVPTWVEVLGVPVRFRLGTPRRSGHGRPVKGCAPDSRRRGPTDLNRVRVGLAPPVPKR